MRSLEGVWHKVDRSKRHIDDVEAQIIAFHESNPYPVVIEDDPRTAGKRIAKIGSPLIALPTSITLCVGDAVHNLRAALDHFVYAAVPAARRSHKTDFPVWRSPRHPTSSEVKLMVQQKARGASALLIDALHRLDAYEGGSGQFVWLLDRLDVVDKHRLLLTVNYAYRSFTFDVAALLRGVADWTADLPVTPVSYRPADRYPVQEGTELFIADAEWFEQQGDNMKFTFEIAFGEPKIIEGEPIVSTLRRMVDEVEGLLKRLIPLV